MKTILKTAVLLLAVILVVAGLVATLRVGPAPVVEIRSDAKAIGSKTSLVVVASAPGRGLAGLRVEVEQGGVVRVVAQKPHRPLPPWAWSGARTEREELRVDVGRSALPELKEGEAVVRVVAERAPTWLRHPAPAVEELRLPVRLVPPTLSLLSSQHYVAQGGSGVVLYRVGRSATRDGVRSGAWFFPGAPLPGGGPRTGSRSSGCRGTLPTTRGCAWWPRTTPATPPRSPSWTVSSRSRRTATRSFSTTPSSRRWSRRSGRRRRGSRIAGASWRTTSRSTATCRKKNAEELVALALRTAGTFLWTEPFLPLRNAKVMSAFADQRTYVYQGKDVDAQTHLGFDLAVVARTPVPAANRGVVLLARYFGIYGNTVVVDHGLGLATLYSHLSSIEVAEGQTVEQGTVLGHTGATGLAGGDHLHFTTLVRGLPVNPVEWWDGAWIRDRVAGKVGPAALAFAGPTSKR